MYVKKSPNYCNYFLFYKILEGKNVLSTYVYLYIETSACTISILWVHLFLFSTRNYRFAKEAKYDSVNRCTLVMGSRSGNYFYKLN